MGLGLIDSSNHITSNQQIETVIIDPINTIQGYSKFMIKELHKYVDTEFALCIQWDAFVLNYKAWDPDYLKYDYIGAPWWFNDEANVGNGGFSLRSKKFLETCSSLPIKNFHPEDLILCRTYRNLIISAGIHFAPESLAHKFSMEGNAKYGYFWQSQLGFHDYTMTDISSWEGYNELIKDETLRAMQFREIHK